MLLLGRTHKERGYKIGMKNLAIFTINLPHNYTILEKEVEMRKGSGKEMFANFNVKKKLS